MKDTEYNGYLVNEARYYEYWETWVPKTCSYTVTHSCGKNCSYTTTHYYDCSYCDYNSAKWYVTDTEGHKYNISQSKYHTLIKQWSATPKFYELNRDIEYHGSCGKDGNMYTIRWDKKIETSESAVIEVPFENPVKTSHSAFQYPNISDENAVKLGLYKYPKIYDIYKQHAILAPFIINSNIQKKFEYINGNFGKKYKIKTFILLFNNKPIDIAFKQEAYWDGGNQNEIVICIGYNKDRIDWVKPFTWCDNKRVVIEAREEIAELGTLKWDNIYDILENVIIKYYHYKSFKDFNYLTFEPTFGQIIFVYLGTLIVSLIAIWICIKYKN
jgi:hypothetical protein